MSALTLARCARRAVWSTSRSGWTALPAAPFSSEPPRPPPTRKGKRRQQPTGTLPDRKMRALIDLYAKTEFFITEENLDKAIDDAFIHAKQVDLDDKFQSMSYAQIKGRVDRQRTAPREVLQSLADSPVLGYQPKLYEDNTPAKQLRLRDALYGVGQQKPSPEVLRKALKQVEEREGQAKADP